jgi:hypothetical protein
MKQLKKKLMAQLKSHAELMLRTWRRLGLRGLALSHLMPPDSAPLPASKVVVQTLSASAARMSSSAA